MASARAIKNRIKSTKNIKQITKAMEAVSAVKMRKSQEIALRSRPYALAALEMLRNLSADSTLEEVYQGPLTQQREVKKSVIVVVTSDKGLCGAFNSTVLRRAQDLITQRADVAEVELVTIGKKAKDFAAKRGYAVRDEYTGIGDYAQVHETNPMAHILRDAFVSGEVDEIMAVYMNFVSVLKQEVVIEQLLPFTKEEIERRVREIVPESGKYSEEYPQALGNTTGEHKGYTFEPSPDKVLDELLPLLLEIAVYHIVLEANASEHSARMVAMKSASENASELIDTLTLSYNKARQAQITKELTEISAGAAALEE